MSISIKCPFLCRNESMNNIKFTFVKFSVKTDRHFKSRKDPKFHKVKSIIIWWVFVRAFLNMNYIDSINTEKV